jgi:putative membrane protein
MLFAALFWIVVIAAIVLGVRWLAGAGRSESGPPRETALDILKTRYAKGEIGREEFEQKKRDLQG